MRRRFCEGDLYNCQKITVEEAKQFQKAQMGQGAQRPYKRAVE